MLGLETLLGLRKLSSCGSALFIYLSRLEQAIPRSPTGAHALLHREAAGTQRVIGSTGHPASRLWVPLCRMPTAATYTQQQTGHVKSIHTVAPTDLHHDGEHRINELLALGPAGTASTALSARHLSPQQYQHHGTQAILDLLSIRTYSGTTAWDRLKLRGLPPTSAPSQEAKQHAKDETGMAESMYNSDHPVDNPAQAPESPQAELMVTGRGADRAQHSDSPKRAAGRGFKEGSGPGPVDVAYRALMGDTYPTRLGLNEARFAMADTARQELEVLQVVRLMQLVALMGYEGAARILRFCRLILHQPHLELLNRLRSLGEATRPAILARGMLPPTTLPVNSSSHSQAGQSGHEHQGVPQGGMPVSQVIPLFFPEANQQAIVATLIEEAAAAGLDEHVRGGMRVAIKDPQVLVKKVPSNVEEAITDMSQQLSLPVAVVRVMLARMPRLLTIKPSLLAQRADLLASALASHNLPGPVTRPHGYNKQSCAARASLIQNDEEEQEDEEEEQPSILTRNFKARPITGRQERKQGQVEYRPPHRWTYTGPNMRSWYAKGRGPLTHSQLLLTLQRRHQVTLWPEAGQAGAEDAAQAAPEQALLRAKAFTGAMMSARPHLLLLDPSKVTQRLRILVDAAAQLPTSLADQLGEFNPSDMAQVLTAPTRHFSRLRFLAQLPAEQLEGEKLCSIVCRSNAAFHSRYPQYTSSGHSQK